VTHRRHAVILQTALPWNGEEREAKKVMGASGGVAAQVARIAERHKKI
jgi:hypothetical protein